MMQFAFVIGKPLCIMGLLLLAKLFSAPVITMACGIAFMMSVFMTESCQHDMHRSLLFGNDMFRQYCPLHSISMLRGLFN